MRDLIAQIAARAFAENLLAARIRRGWDVPQLAVESGVGRVAIRRAEDGRDITLTEAVALALAPGIPLEDMLRPSSVTGRLP